MIDSGQTYVSFSISLLPIHLMASNEAFSQVKQASFHPTSLIHQ